MYSFGEFKYVMHGLCTYHETSSQQISLVLLLINTFNSTINLFLMLYIFLCFIIISGTVDWVFS